MIHLFAFFSRKFDIFIGALDENDVTRNVFVASRPYYHDTLTWCVKKDPAAPLWKQPFLITKDYSLHLTLMSLGMLVGIVVYYIHQYERFQWNYLRIMICGLSMAFAYPHRYQPRNSMHRIMYIIYASACLINSTVWSTFMMRTITHPYLDREIRTIDDILNYNLRLIGDNFTFQKLREQKTVTSFCEFDDKFL